jgi:hypothetical protein
VTVGSLFLVLYVEHGDENNKTIGITDIQNVYCKVSSYTFSHAQVILVEISDRMILVRLLDWFGSLCVFSRCTMVHMSI